VRHASPPARAHGFLRDALLRRINDGEIKMHRTGTCGKAFLLPRADEAYR